jgi:hypothetical protein
MLQFILPMVPNSGSTGGQCVVISRNLSLHRFFENLNRSDIKIGYAYKPFACVEIKRFLFSVVTRVGGVWRDA